MRKITNSLVSNMPQTVIATDAVIKIIGRLGRTPIFEFSIEINSLPEDRKSRTELLFKKIFSVMKTDNIPIGSIVNSQLDAIDAVLRL